MSGSLVFRAEPFSGLHMLKLLGQSAAVVAELACALHMWLNLRFAARSLTLAHIFPAVHVQSGLLCTCRAFVANSWSRGASLCLQRQSCQTLRMASTADFKNGLTIEVDGAPNRIIEFLHVKVSNCKVNSVALCDHIPRPDLFSFACAAWQRSCVCAVEDEELGHRQHTRKDLQSGKRCI